MKFSDLNVVYNRIQDEESRYIFDLRLSYAVDRNEGNFIKGIYEMEKKWNITPDDDISSFYDGEKIVIYGAGINGLFTKKILEENGYDVFAFCDSDLNKVNSMIDGIKVISPDSIKDFSDVFVIVASKRFWAEIYTKLTTIHGWKRQNVFVPRLGTVLAYCGRQYFDCDEVEVDTNDIFVDVGVYDGETSAYVLKNYNVDKVIGLEANKDMYEKVIARYAGNSKVKIYPYAAWNTKENLRFSSYGGGSNVNEVGDTVVKGETIDNILNSKFGGGG